MEKINQLTNEDHQRTINDIGDVVGLSYISMQAILMSELNHYVEKILHRSLSRSLSVCY